jgi:3-oxoacyl-[acyl-carrier protein] reductase
MADSEFQDKVVVVTGAGSGIGYATARRFAESGAIVGLNDVNPERAHEAARDFNAGGGRCEPLVFDVTDSHSIDQAFDMLAAREGHLDIVVNNAGILRSVPGHGERRAAMMQRRAAGQPGGSLGVTVNTSDTLWREHMAVMLDGVFYGTRAALRHMEAQGFGAIVNTASIGAFHPAPDYPFYAAAKAGVVAFTRSVGHEVAGAGIRVNAVAPGSTATAIMVGTDTGSFSSRNASGRIGKPEEIAEAIAFLASDRASYCFGEILTVSGAWA